MVADIQEYKDMQERALLLKRHPAIKRWVPRSFDKGAWYYGHKKPNSCKFKQAILWLSNFAPWKAQKLPATVNRTAKGSTG
ncbi:MAG TPA: hypothetical protein VGC86_08550 [Afipia sp.]